MSGLEYDAVRDSRPAEPADGGVAVRNYRLITGFAALVPVAAIAVLATPQSAVAQRRQQQNLERVLVLPPMPADAADSAYVLELAAEIRDKLSGRVRNQVTVITTEQYCEALAASGFDCGFLPDRTSGDQLAQFLRADAYATGDFDRSSTTPTVRLRIVDIGRSGISGWLTAAGEEGQTAADFANIISDSLRNQVRAGRDARDCGVRRDRSDFKGARDRAERVFAVYPNHPSAAQCVAYLFEATQQPPDSLIWAYRKLVSGDSLQSRSWERLARLYLSNNDTLNAIEAFNSQLNVDPGNRELRVNVIRMWSEQGSHDRAIEVLDGGLSDTPDDLALLQLQATTCFGAEDWSCAVTTLARLYEANPELVGDSIFYVQVTGAAELAGDSAAQLRWTEEAVTRLPESLHFWRQRAGVLAASGDKDALLAAYGRWAELDATDTRPLLARTGMLVEAFTVDTSVAPLDMDGLMDIQSLLTTIESMAPDDVNAKRSLAVFYYQPASKLTQGQVRPDLAMVWLEKAMELDVDGRLGQAPNFFYGFATLLYLGQFFAEVQQAEAPVREDLSNTAARTALCTVLSRYQEIVTLGVQRMQLGQSISPEGATQIMAGLEQHKSIADQYNAAYCSGDAPNGGP